MYKIRLDRQAPERLYLFKNSPAVFIEDGVNMSGIFNTRQSF